MKILILLWAGVLGFVGPDAPKTLVLEGDHLAQNLQRVKNGNPAKRQALQALLQKADGVLKDGQVYAVTKKTQVPPSGDKHDYMSMGPYWWPDPSKPDGKPYIRKDGERNPEIRGITDHDQLGRVEQEAELLALAYYFTGDEKYARHAARILNTWFLDEATRMNPNLNFGQGIPGRTQGRGIGIIETRELYRVIDAAILLQSSGSWSRTQHTALQKWFSDYLTWLTESPIGKDEADEHNNHGTHYDVQVISFALFTGRNELVHKQLSVVKARLDSQLQPDGSQPHELARTLSWNYSSMNLYGFLVVARLAEHVSADLWNYKTPEGKGIRQAIDWMLKYSGNDKEWKYTQIKPRSYDTFADILNIASQKYKEPRYAAEAKRIEERSGGADIYDQLTRWAE